MVSTVAAAGNPSQQWRVSNDASHTKILTLPSSSAPLQNTCSLSASTVTKLPKDLKLIVQNIDEEPSLLDPGYRILDRHAVSRH